MRKRPVNVNEYRVYQYEHADDLSFIRMPAEIDPMVELANPADIEALLKGHGWEGDGRLGILWLPPFVTVGGEDTWGAYIWFVKQSNNGTAFMASEHELNFPRLHRQNRDRPVWKGLFPGGLVRSSRESLDRESAAILSELQEDIALVRSLPSPARLQAHLTERSQGRMVQALMGFLDDCYLRILHEVIADGNGSNLKLRKAKATLAPSDYLPGDIEGDAGGFFTLAGLISDLWASYKFEPFQVKLEMLLKPIELQPPGDIMFELRKHVLLRNAIQHHDGWIDQKLLDDIGRAFVPMMTADGPGRLEPSSAVGFPLEEIQALDQSLRAFGCLLDDRVEERVASKFYARRRG